MPGFRPDLPPDEQDYLGAERSHERVIGALQAQMEANGARIERFERDTALRLASIEAEVKKIVTTLATAAGAKVVLAVGVRWAMGFVTSAALLALSWFHDRIWR